MKTTLFGLALCAGIAMTPGLPFHCAASAGPAEDSTPLTQLAQLAVSTDTAQAAVAIAALRARGPAGLQALLDVHSELLKRSSTAATPRLAPVRNEAWERLRTALDTVGQQRDCHASKLFWFTDLEQAKATARASGKPILSLRLLGKLDEEYSCANSRFFRTTLYANEEVSQYLRDHFVLHWKSVRPVPRITIDMGDGRKIERTITGNSIHYVLDSEGRPIDALPGLYGAKAFIAGLDRAITTEQQASKLSGSKRELVLKNYHATRLTEIQQQWSRDLAQIGGIGSVTSVAAVQNPDAIKASSVAVVKGRVEMPLLRAGAQTDFAADRSRLDAASGDSTWAAIAALHSDEARLDASSRRLVGAKQYDAADAARRAFSKSFVEDPLLRVMRNFERSIAEDTVRNEYQFHSRIHEWFANGTAPADLDRLNTKVYAELFLTPDSDPWLGLAPANVFSALDGGGLVQTSQSTATR